MPLAAFQYSLRVILIRNVPFGTHEAEVVRVSPPILFPSQYNQQKRTFFQSAQHLCERYPIKSSWDAVGLIKIHSQVELWVCDYNSIPITIVGTELEFQVRLSHSRLNSQICLRLLLHSIIIWISCSQHEGVGWANAISTQSQSAWYRSIRILV